VELLQRFLKWLFTDDHWALLMIPPILLVFGFISYDMFFNDDPLRDRQTRTAIFDALMDEMNSLETPPNTGVTEVEGNHKSASILVKRHYHSDASSRDDVIRSINQSLTTRGWIQHSGRPERTTIRTYYYRRGAQEATLYLLEKSFFDDASKDDWDLVFSQ
jgi:hypothetical protein